MAGFDPEVVQDALFQRLKDIPGLGQCKQRRLAEYDGVPPERQPALIVSGTGGYAQQASDLPMFTWVMEALVYLYVREPTDKAQTAETVIFGLVKKIKEALLPQDGERQGNRAFGTTLGGLVESCIIRGYMVDVFGDGQTVTALKIEMVTAD